MYTSNSASDSNDMSHLYMDKKRAFKCQLESLKKIKLIPVYYSRYIKS